jgi:hypothetical protein
MKTIFKGAKIKTDYICRDQNHSLDFIGKLVNGLTILFLILIPKVVNPQRFSDFRHISLVGCMYKVLAKMLANRLKLVINKIIYETQSAFIKGTHILDGILFANVVVDDAKKLNKELIMFKVDFEKAYDSVKWEYLDSVIAKLDNDLCQFGYCTCSG